MGVCKSVCVEGRSLTFPDCFLLLQESLSLRSWLSTLRGFVQFLVIASIQEPLTQVQSSCSLEVHCLSKVHYIETWESKGMEWLSVLKGMRVLNFSFLCCRDTVARNHKVHCNMEKSLFWHSLSNNINVRIEIPQLSLSKFACLKICQY